MAARREELLAAHQQMDKPASGAQFVTENE